MNKEEIEARLKAQTEINIELLDSVYEWKLQCKELKERIDKAIEYVENHKYKYWDGLGEIGIEDREFEKDTNPEDLLEILKGDNNENN